MKIIVALDFANLDETFRVVACLDPEKWILKIGSEMFTRFGPELVRMLVNKGYKVFLDLKFHDIPNTVAKAILAAADLNVWMLNVHASGGIPMMKAARAAVDSLSQNRPLVIAVTVLTSEPVYDSYEKRVSELALASKEAGLDGIVCAAREVPLIKTLCGPSFLTITPGIRLPEDPCHDQARIATPEEAYHLGSDYLVIGRSITDSANPKKVISELLALID